MTDVAVADQSGVKATLATRAEDQQQDQQGETIKQALDRQKIEISKALGQRMSVDKFSRTVLTECRRNPRLMTCTAPSMFGAVMYAAQLNLEPGPLGHCWLVPYRNNTLGVDEVQFILGYKGMIELARRSGDVLSIVAREVCENDEFHCEYGLDEQVIHRPPIFEERGKTIGYYGVARFRGGGHYVLAMGLKDIEKRRARSKAKDRGPWKTDYDAMARKSVIRAMQPYLPLTVEAGHAWLGDEQIHEWTPGLTEPKAIDVPAPEPEPEEQPEQDDSPSGEANPTAVEQLFARATAAGEDTARRLDEWLNEQGYPFDHLTVDQLVEAGAFLESISAGSPPPADDAGGPAPDGPSALPFSETNPLEKWSKGDLQAALKEKGKPTSGTIPELAARLREAIRAEDDA